MAVGGQLHACLVRVLLQSSEAGDTLFASILVVEYCRILFCVSPGRYCSERIPLSSSLASCKLLSARPSCQRISTNRVPYAHAHIIAESAHFQRDGANTVMLSNVRIRDTRRPVLKRGERSGVGTGRLRPKKAGVSPFSQLALANGRVLESGCSP